MFDTGRLPPSIRSKIAVREEDTCWPWTGALSGAGYGHIKYEGRIQEAHRVVYRLLVGHIPDGLLIDHLCHTPDCKTVGKACPHRRCQNPGHMALRTFTQNVLRGNSPPAVNARKTHCARGHEYGPDTCVLDQGSRRCLICRRAFDRRRRPRKTTA